MSTVKKKLVTEVNSGENWEVGGMGWEGKLFTICLFVL